MKKYIVTLTEIKEYRIPVETMTTDDNRILELAWKKLEKTDAKTKFFSDESEGDWLIEEEEKED